MLKQIENDLTIALKSGDKFKLSVLRMLKSEIHNAEISKKEILTDDEVLSIIKKQVKVRTDSKEEYSSYNRLDLAENLEKEIDILNVYLPEELSDAELNNIIDNLITPESTVKSMGIIIKTIQNEYGNRVDMKKVSLIVKEKLK